MQKPIEHIFGKLTPYGLWLKECRLSKTYGWKMRKRKMLTTINLGGKLYITSDEIEHFLERAKDGQFAKTPRMPSPRLRTTASVTASV